MPPRAPQGNSSFFVVVALKCGPVVLYQGKECGINIARLRGGLIPTEANHLKNCKRKKKVLLKGTLNKDV